MQKVDKFIRFAEVLPKNANTANILKEREEIALQKAERDKAVSIAPRGMTKNVYSSNKQQTRRRRTVRRNATRQYRRKLSVIKRL